MTKTQDDRRTVLKILAGSGAYLLLGCRAPSAARVKTMITRAPHPPLHEALAGYVERGEIPGIVALVARRGEVSVEAIGTTAANGTTPVARDTLFRIASMTKPVAAAAALILVEEGKLRLDEPVDRLLPELANRRVLRRIDGELDDTVPARRPIEIRDLLTFTMGIGVVFAPPGSYPIQRAMDELELGQGMPRPQTPPAPDEWIRRLGTLPLIHQPGERWMYGTGSDVLAVAIARAAGQPFDAFLRERIFAPLGMVDTGFAVPAAKRARFATSYVVDPATNGLALLDAVDGQWSRPPAFPSGAAGLVSTVDDFLAFGTMLLERGAHGRTRILSERSADALARDQLTPAQKAASNEIPGFFASHGWGYGVAVVTGPDDSGAPGAFGWDGGLGTSWRSSPAEQMVTILLTQRAWTSPIPPPVCRDFWRAARTAT